MIASVVPLLFLGIAEPSIETSVAVTTPLVSRSLVPPAIAVSSCGHSQLTIAVLYTAAVAAEVALP